MTSFRRSSDMVVCDVYVVCGEKESENDAIDTGISESGYGLQIEEWKGEGARGILSTDADDTLNCFFQGWQKAAGDQVSAVWSSIARMHRQSRCVNCAEIGDRTANRDVEEQCRQTVLTVTTRRRRAKRVIKDGRWVLMMVEGKLKDRALKLLRFRRRYRCALSD
ncbi:phenylalanine ammonia-lyase [Pseudozyma hubeiensis SY62]|uniref:Phenylalanine ammonia-lyase n=1 Tax=Pseudozyma hubeiensis (strain SY62) TaxID=1305764 RepID=R9P0L7_PSEHS|nr:phenylalanine ammonia-lyase [Pseudozyma hubeiensis SY62]GAC94696.1 phenylalanine ammonia-lyase [Pseudozyma hubeiensis SY62]